MLRKINLTKKLASNLLITSMWFGLLSGLVEGIIFLIAQKLGRVMGVSIEIIWISSFFNFFLFSAVGICLSAVYHCFPRLPIVTVSIFSFLFLTALDYLLLISFERISQIAIVILALGLAVEITRRLHRRETVFVNFVRKSFPWVLSFVLLAFFGVQGGQWVKERTSIAALPKASSGTPNIIVIVVDALRADHLSTYGYLRNTSPMMDKLAQQGVLFENAFSTSGYSLPSHVSLMTGLYPFEHGAEWYKAKALLEGNYHTIAEAFKSQGYRTAGFSANVFWVTREQGFGRGFIHFEDYFQSIGDMTLRTFYGRVFEELILRRLGFEDIPARRRAPDINCSIIRWVTRDQEKPFFVFVNYMDTHDPYLPPQPYRGMYSSQLNPGGILNWRVGRDDPSLTPEQIQGEIDAYDGSITFVDDNIKQLLLKLDQLGLSQNTLIIITSDHGEAFGEHGMFLHANSLHREVIGVPLILWWPGHVPSGIRIDRPVTNAALPMTIMDLIGRGEQASFPGPSLAKLWEDPQSSIDWPNPLAEMAQEDWQPERYPIRSGWIETLIGSKWQYIEYEKLNAELFDWKDDPEEQNNLIDNPAMQDIAKELHQSLRVIKKKN